MCSNENQETPLLLIDDDPTVLESFKLWLEDEGYYLHTAASKEEALEILKHHPVEVCLIDLKMKEEDGLQITEEIKKIDSLLKIIIITGYPSYEPAIDAMKIGVFDYVSKASENKDILSKIKKAIDTRREELAAKGERAECQHPIILVCNHMMITEGYETFSRENPSFCVAHTYHSVEYIRGSDFNHKASLLLLCATCNQHCLEKPEEMFPRLNLLFPNAHPVMINCQTEDAKKKRLITFGVRGFLPKDISKENMKRAFQSILNGEIWASRKVVMSLLSELLEKGTASEYLRLQNPFNLSNREIQILQAIASGLSNLEISDKLYISEKTVKAHINHIFKKLGVKSRTQAVKKAVEEYII
jgi:DNA-binding NarL/FixJ family response regulator